MSWLKKTIPQNWRLYLNIFESYQDVPEIHQFRNLYSANLDREVRVDVYLPSIYYDQPGDQFPVLWFNDGQDMDAARLLETMTVLFQENRVQEFVLVAIHAGNRIQEYGAAGRPDYRRRGSLAGAYTRFIVEELVPFLRKRYRLSHKAVDNTFAGFSLGGLSAFDIAWANPQLFRQAGVFSGSFWWRFKPVDPVDPDAHRIMHDIVAKSRKREGMRFWFQCGTRDEYEDRNNNGIIDSIDDTVDLIALLKKLGYREGRDIYYLEVKDGEHNHDTWARVMPQFLIWAFPRYP